MSTNARSDFGPAATSDLAKIEEIADAVLYEGYVLYPYRASSVKNRQRWNFGGLFPRAYSEANCGSDAWQLQTECLIELPATPTGRWPTVDIRLRFLQVSIREVGRLAAGKAPSSTAPEADPCFERLESVVVNGQTIHTWQEAVDRNVVLEAVPLTEIAGWPVVHQFSFPADRKVEVYPDEIAPDEDDEVKTDSVVIVRRQEQIDGKIKVSPAAVSDGLFRLRVVVQNNTPLNDLDSHSRDEVAIFAMASTHLILGCSGGKFVSLMDPPAAWSQFAAECKNIGCWPVLAGEEPRRDFLLASPIILYDYPQIAPESAGQLFDGTEIDEILTLRIMTLTDEEKQEMRSLDDHTRAILERTENLPQEQLAKLHGAIRGLRKLHPTET